MGSDEERKAAPAFAGSSGNAVQDAATPAKARKPGHVPPPHIDPPKTLSQKFAEAVTHLVGSPKFVIAQTATLAAWLLGNTLGIVQHWDPQPFILLNLMLSFQAAYTGPFVMIAQNRQGEIDRLAEEYDHRVNLEAQKNIEEVHRMVDTILTSLSPMVKLMTAEQVKGLSIPDDILEIILEGPRKDEDAAAKLLAEDDPPAVKTEKLTLSQKFSAAVANGVGSLKFIGLQSLAIGAWLGLNTFAFVNHWDPYPYILLNLMLSFQAAYTGPFVLMSQNRQSALDRAAKENDHQVNRDAQARLEDLKRKLGTLNALVAPVMAALTPEQHERLAKMMVPKPPVIALPPEKAPEDHVAGHAGDAGGIPEEGEGHPVITDPSRLFPVFASGPPLA
jgi:uncharacterized membrane protein